MGFGEGSGSVSKRGGGQEVVDHDKGHRLTKGKPRTSYKDPRDKRPIAPLLHLPRIFPFLLSHPFSLPFLAVWTYARGRCLLNFHDVYIYIHVYTCHRSDSISVTIRRYQRLYSFFWRRGWPIRRNDVDEYMLTIT